MKTTTTSAPTLHTPSRNEAQRNEQQGTALMVLGGVILGTIGVFITEAGQDPLTTVLFRCLFGGLALLLWGLALGRCGELKLRGKALLGALAAGLLMATNWGLYFAAIPLTSIGVATVIIHIQPFWLMALGAWLLNEQVSKKQVCAALIALSGLVLASGLLDGVHDPRYMSRDYLLGVALCLGASLAYAGVTLLAKVLTGVSSFALAGWQCLVGVLLTAWWPLLNGWPQALSSWAWLAGLGSIHTGLAYAILYAGISRLGTSRVALLQFVYPIAAVLVDWAVYGHTLTAIQLFGVVLMAMTLWSVRRSA